MTVQVAENGDTDGLLAFLPSVSFNMTFVRTDHTSPHHLLMEGR